MKSCIYYIRLLSFALLAITVFSNCEQSDRLDISDYYYPANLSEEGLVYQYITTQENNEEVRYPRYTYALKLEKDSGTYIVKNHYKHDFFNDQMVVYEEVDNGILLNNYRIIKMIPEKDSQQIQEAGIIRDNVFPYSVCETGGVTPMEILIDNPEDDKEKITLIRERQYLGDTIYTFKGQDIPAVVFAANEVRRFRHELDGDIDETTYATEIYAKGIGLISRRYNIGQAQLESVLYDTFSMDKLEFMANKYWEE